jgi:hypothetical protein
MAYAPRTVPLAFTYMHLQTAIELIRLRHADVAGVAPKDE